MNNLKKVLGIFKVSILILWKNFHEIKPAGPENCGSRGKTYFVKFWLDIEYNQKKFSLKNLHIDLILAPKLPNNPKTSNIEQFVCKDSKKFGHFTLFNA